MKASTWTNNDGLVVGFGAQTSETKRGGKPETDGNIEEHVVEFSYDALPDGTGPATDGGYGVIPAGAIPIDAYLEVLTAFAGGTSYDMDLVDSTGTAIGSGTDKLFDGILLAALTPAGKRAVSSTDAGTHSGDALNVALASAGSLKVTAAGTFTAGKARLVIRYIR